MTRGAVGWREHDTMRRGAAQLDKTTKRVGMTFPNGEEKRREKKCGKKESFEFFAGKKIQPAGMDLDARITLGSPQPI